VIPATTPYRVLLVDDRPESLSGLRVQLEMRGHRVDSVEGVLYAMWAVNASHRVYDLVVCAVELADGDGIELMARLRERMGVRTIGLICPGADAVVRRASASPAVDLVLPHPGGARPNEPLCEAICDAASNLMRAVQPKAPGPAVLPAQHPTPPTIHPPSVA
jgi:CheY-like chemotaxis protein